LTLACGTGACASIIVGLKNKNMVGKVKTRTEGGVLFI
jgi:diaminopimelate epimerase